MDENGQVIKEEPNAQQVPEEQFMDPDDEEQANWSTEEIPPKYREKLLKVPKSIRNQVRRMHRGLGHPSRETMIKMMKTAGARSEAIEYARRWDCPICQAAMAPKKPLNASARLRPYKFNHTVAVDLKYLKDSIGKQRVALHAVCCGTGFQAACMLKTLRFEQDATPGQFIQNG